MSKRPRARRSKSEAIDDSGQDAFLDIVTNVVGVLVILVLVVGVRASQTPVKPTNVVKTENGTTDDEGKALQAKASSLFSQSLGFVDQARQMAVDAQVMSQTRNEIQMRLAEAEQEVNSRRAKLDEEARRDFDLQTTIEAHRRELTELMQQKISLSSMPSKSVKIENSPTPLSKSVDQEELHFQLKEGRILYVPVTPLVEALKKELPHEARRLYSEKRPQRVRSVGPIDGFRMQYTLRLVNISPERQIELGVTSPQPIFDRWEIIPPASNRGETIDQALAENSKFNRTLLLNSPERVSVTIWSYPDSFDGFQRLKKVMYAAGYQTAARPLSKDTRIAGSPSGTRSAAQ